MTMRKILIIFVGLVILFSPLGHAEEASVTPKVLDHEEDYIVKEGDTLWDISKRFYNDPFLWPRLWQQNQYITNPHHISPGDRIRLYPYRVLIETEEVPPPIVDVEEKKPPMAEEVPPPLTSPLAVFKSGVDAKELLAPKVRILAVLEVELYQTCPSVTLAGSDERYCTFCPNMS